MPEPRVAGVDWAGDGWVAVVFEDRTFEECVHDTRFEVLLEGIDLALVDIPIGLPSDQKSREHREQVDAEARSWTGRPSSVFPVPSRGAAELAHDGGSYEAVSERNEADIGKGLSRQSYHVAPAVGEIDRLVRSSAIGRDMIVEAHPEVCFRAFKTEPLECSKLTASGVGERITALENVLDTPEDVVADIVKGLIVEATEAAVDDVLDALALAVTARSGLEQLRFLPEGHVQTDLEGVPMRMAYREPER